MNGTTVAPAYQSLHCGACALKDRLNPTIAQIAHPALNSGLTCPITHIGTKIHSLNPT